MDVEGTKPPLLLQVDQPVSCPGVSIGRSAAGPARRFPVTLALSAPMARSEISLANSCQWKRKKPLESVQVYGRHPAGNSSSPFLMLVDVLRNEASCERPLQLLHENGDRNWGRRRAWEAKHAESRHGKPIKAARTGGRAVNFALGRPRIAKMGRRAERDGRRDGDYRRAASEDVVERRRGARDDAQGAMRMSGGSNK
jgi:hypothetical protein